MSAIIQKLKKNVKSDLQKATKYFSILSVLNDLNLTEKQVALLAYTAVHGSITNPSCRAEFIQMFDSSFASLENIKSKLSRKGWLVKIDGKYEINPRLNLDFTKDIILQINLPSDGGDRDNST